jgi:hypothetical protein
MDLEMIDSLERNLEVLRKRLTCAEMTGDLTSILDLMVEIEAEAHEIERLLSTAQQAA